MKSARSVGTNSAQRGSASIASFFATIIALFAATFGLHQVATTATPIANSSMPELQTAIATSSAVTASSSVVYQNTQVQNPYEQTRTTSISSNDWIPASSSYNEYEKYRVIDGKIYYSDEDFSDDQSQPPVLVTTANVSSFEVFDPTDLPYAPDSPYAKDDSTVYCRGEPLPAADPKTFTVIVSHPSDEEVGAYFLLFSKDKSHVFEDCSLFSQPSIDANSFVLVGTDPNLLAWFHDNQHVFYTMDGQNLQILDGADPSTFVVLLPADDGAIFAKDKNHVYLMNNQGMSILGDADPATFVVGCPAGWGCDAHDTNHLY